MRVPCARDDCAAEPQPLDTIRWVGFGPFAAVPSPLAGCAAAGFGIDTLRYGALEIDEAGNVSGTQFVFQRVADSVRGAQIDPEDGRARPIALQELTRATGTDSLLFWTAAGGATKYEHRVALSCDRIAGSYRVVKLPYGQDPGSTGSYDTFTVARAGGAPPAAR